MQESLMSDPQAPQEASPAVAPEAIASSPTSESVHFNRNKKWMGILPILGVVALLMGTLVVLTSTGKSQDVRSRAALTGPVLALSPATKTANVGETFSVGMTINTNSDTVSAGEFHITYDKTALEIVSFTPGAALPVVLVPETHAGGAIAVTLGAQPTSPLKGAGILGTWNVKILAAKNSTLTITSATQVAAISKTTNALASATGSSITGTTNGGPTATPTPTPINAPTSTPTPTLTQPTPTPTPPSNYVPPTATPTPLYTPNNTPAPTQTTNTKPNVGFGNITTPQPAQGETPMVTTQPTDVTNTNELSQAPSIPSFNTRETEVPKTNVFQQVLNGILQFFQRLFSK